MKKYLSIFLLCFFFSMPAIARANGGVFYWPPMVNVSQTDQNAIISWDGTQEILILSTGWEKPDDNSEVTLLKTIPLPSEPSEIKEGDPEVFDKLVGAVNAKRSEMREDSQKLNNWSEGAGTATGSAAPSVEVVIAEKIGSHDVTVVKVNKESDFSQWIDGFAAGKKLEQKQISQAFKDGLASYLKRGINYFVFDVVDLSQEKAEIKPLTYTFKTDYFYFPMLVSGISEIANSDTDINVHLVYDKKFTLPARIWNYGQDSYSYSVYDDGVNVEFTNLELKAVSEKLADFTKSDVLIRTFKTGGTLKEIKKDLMLFPRLLTSNLYYGMQSNDVKILQQLLVNEGFWDSPAAVTGYFGPATKAAVMKFQAAYSEEILKPLGLTAPTGYFGPYTRNYLNNNIFVAQAAN